MIRKKEKMIDKGRPGAIMCAANQPKETYMKAQSGFTVLEALLAASIIAIGIGVLMAVFQASFTITYFTEEQNASITALTNQAERLKAADLPMLTTEFGPLFDLVSPFTVPGLMKLGGGANDPAEGWIQASLPTGNASDYIEFLIHLEYRSELGDPEVEEVTIWISPIY